MLKRCKATNKVCHPTKEQALHVQRKLGTRKMVMNTFKCPKCKQWHMGQSRNSNRFQELIDAVIRKDKRKATG